MVAPVAAECCSDTINVECCSDSINQVCKEVEDGARLGRVLHCFQLVVLAMVGHGCPLDPGGDRPPVHPLAPEPAALAVG
jgi:hypothetical protein